MSEEQKGRLYLTNPASTFQLQVVCDIHEDPIPARNKDGRIFVGRCEKCQEAIACWALQGILSREPENPGGREGNIDLAFKYANEIIKRREES